VTARVNAPGDKKVDAKTDNYRKDRRCSPRSSYKMKTATL
jgi:hypothetical protein